MASRVVLSAKITVPVPPIGLIILFLDPNKMLAYKWMNTAARHA
jgi:hypothetical protein